MTRRTDRHAASVGRRPARGLGGSGLRQWRVAVGSKRRWLAAGFAAAAVAAALRAVAPPPPTVVEVVAAAHDLRPGVALTSADTGLTALPPAAVPAGALRSPDAAVGRTVSGPVRRGETLTDVRLLGPAMIRAGLSGEVAAPVRIADSATVALLHPGDEVDVLAATTGAGGTAAGEVTTVAAAARVVTVPAVAADALGGQTDGALVVLATPPREAAALARAAVVARLSVTLLAR